MTNTQITQGDEVTIVISFRSSLYEPWYPNQPKTLTFSGKVVGHTDIDGPDTVRITGDSSMPVRVIHFSKILLWNNKAFKYTPTQPKSKNTVSKGPTRHKVTGSKGNEYTITIYPDGRRTCSCPGFGYRQTCRHSTEYKE